MDAVPGKWTDPTYETFIRCMHLTGSGIICSMELFLTDQTEKEEEVVEPCIQEQDITIFPAAADGNGQPAAGDTQQETAILPATDPVCMLVPVEGKRKPHRIR